MSALIVKRIVNSCILFLFGFVIIFHPSEAHAAKKEGFRRAVSQSYFIADSSLVIKGEALFRTNCSPCHNFLQRGIGPNLAGITKDVSPQWLSRFIKNAPEVINSGDSRGKMLFEQYNQYMPAFASLEEQDIRAILAFIDTHPGSSSTNTANLGPPVKDPVPAKIPRSGLTLVLKELTQAPATSIKIPLARINQTRILAGKKERVFLQELRGLIYEMKGRKFQVFMDIRKERPGFIDAPGLATGFGSFAFHPDFHQNGLFYTTHTEKARSAPADFSYADSVPVFLQWVLTEWKMNDPHSATFSGTGRELLRINMVSNIHGVQEITFNPLAQPGGEDYGLLYIGVGDGGSAEAKYDFVCNSLNTPWSSVLRIDPRGNNSRNRRYGIPPSNPYAADGDSSTLAEVFCRGFRNPNRISWSHDGKMIISDIGLANIEELNLGIAGADYGWPVREGTFLLNTKGQMDRVYALPANDSSFHYSYPVAQFDHDEGNAISGGFVYSGRIPLLRDKYIFGDIVRGRVFYVENKDLKSGHQAAVREMQVRLGQALTNFQKTTGHKKTDLRFALGPKNQLLIFTKTDGKIYKVTDCRAER